MSDEPINLHIIFANLYYSCIPEKYPLVSFDGHIFIIRTMRCRVFVYLLWQSTDSDLRRLQ